jgi:DNA primase
MIPDSFKQDLLNRVDIVDVVSRYVQLKKGGANWQGLCPFHTEKSPSFTVSPAKQFYHCFGCGAHGNAIGFMMAYASMGYVDAVKDLAASAGMTVPEAPRTPQEAQRRERETDLYAVMEKAMDFFRAQLKDSPKAVAYLKGRGLTGEIAARFRIGYAPDDWQGLKSVFPEYQDKSLAETGLVIDSDEGRRYDRFRDRVMFPIFSQRGSVIGFGGRIMGEGEPKYLNSPETALFEKGRELYGLTQARDAIRAAGRVLVVEGYMDVVALAQFGVGYAVATLGTATTLVHVTKLLRLADEIVFCFDGDKAGRKAAWRALEVSLPLAVDHKPMRFLFLPAEDDPDSYVRKHGQEAFESLARDAPTLSGFLLGELRAEADLATAEGRSKFLTEAKPHVQKITAAGLKLQIVKEVAELGGVSQEEAEGLLEVRPSSARNYARRAPARSATPLVNSHEQFLLRCVLAKPSLVRQIEFDLLDSRRSEVSILQKIADMNEESEPSLALLIDHFQESEDGDLFFRTIKAMEDHGPTDETAEQEFRHNVIQLRIKRKDEECKSLQLQAGADRAYAPAYKQSLDELHMLKGMLTDRGSDLAK